MHLFIEMYCHCNTDLNQLHIYIDKKRIHPQIVLICFVFSLLAQVELPSLKPVENNNKKLTAILVHDIGKIKRLVAHSQYKYLITY